MQREKRGAEVCRAARRRRFTRARTDCSLGLPLGMQRDASRAAVANIPRLVAKRSSGAKRSRPFNPCRSPLVSVSSSFKLYRARGVRRERCRQGRCRCARRCSPPARHGDRERQHDRSLYRAPAEVSAQSVCATIGLPSPPIRSISISMSSPGLRNTGGLRA